nr:hypothetical protein [Methylobacterium sp. ZNC0032]
MSAPDPIHAAAAAYRAAQTAAAQAGSRHAAMAATLAAAKASSPAEIECSLAGLAIKLRSHRAIDRLFRRAREGQEREPALAAAEQRLRDDLDSERQRIAAVRSSINAAGTEQALADAQEQARAAYLTAVRVVPSTLAGLRVLAELIQHPPAPDWNLIEPARRSLATAAAVLLPESHQ